MNNPVLLIAIPLLLGFISIMFKNKKSFIALGLAANVALLFFIEKGEYLLGGFKTPFGISLVVDDFSFIGIVLVNVLFFLTVIMSMEEVGKYSTVLLIALAGLNGLLLTGDLFNLFVFLEVSAIAAYILSSKSGKFHFTFNYLVIGTLGSGLYLFGLIILYVVFGSLNMADISVQMAASSANLILPILLIFSGIAVESKLLPFNGWVKGIYGNVDGLIGPMFASVYAGTMLMVFGRLFGSVLALSDYAVLVITVIGIVTMFAGEAAAFGRKNLREILLYSSIGQSGLVVVLFTTGLIFPAMLQLFNNVVAKLIMFTVAGKVSKETGTDDVDQLQGLFLKNKLVGIAFTTATLSLIGLPVFFGFFSKLNLLLGLFSIANYWVPAIILIATIIEGAYFIRLLVKLWTPGEEGVEANEEYATSLNVEFEPVKIFVTLALAAIIIAAGIMPSLVTKNVLDDSTLLDQSNPSYMFDVEGGM